MKRIAALILAGALIALLSVLSPVGLAQTTPTRWRYAYLYAVQSYDPAVAYVEADECRIAPIAIDSVNVMSTRRLADWHTARTRAIAGTLRTLGENGWEMIGEGPAYCHYESHTAIHFKRPE